MSESGKQFTEWEKIFVNHVAEKVLVLGTDKECLQLNNKKRDIQVKNEV